MISFRKGIPTPLNLKKINKQGQIRFLKGEEKRYNFYGAPFVLLLAQKRLSRVIYLRVWTNRPFCGDRLSLPSRNKEGSIGFRLPSNPSRLIFSHPLAHPFPFFGIAALNLNKKKKKSEGSLNVFQWEKARRKWPAEKIEDSCLANERRKLLFIWRMFCKTNSLSRIFLFE